MKREDLKALGLTDEQIDKIMAQNGQDIENAKKPYKDYDDVKGQLKTATDTIETLKKTGGDVEKLNKQIEDYKATIANMQTEATNKAKTAALVDALKAEKIADPDYFIFKQGGVEKFNFDKDNKPIGVGDMVKPFRETNKNWFEQEPQPAFSGFRPNQSNMPTPTDEQAMQDQVNKIFGIKGDDK